jgi:hypothetical protein
MPELKWAEGYPSGWVTIVVSGSPSLVWDKWKALL